jgi:hypothetical protein
MFHLDKYMEVIKSTLNQIPHDKLKAVKFYILNQTGSYVVEMQKKHI